ncbi:MAG: hypothetical protein GWM92_02365, partial [Gemmatimonadetes bacterium]|nr:hypothetical protein [Gemmatimonadota bacterium]NIR77316.1 hypothetical protein [Gemmatimonadota bacterium]NIT85840.1 hypothetical protein [Gemmatimonadota bacterium]NIU29663.1 hypothetical protein [Gemmatimonadota bacterium]NIU34707.1 hypothetical protein [Gemmatimonadota bacterium]
APALPRIAVAARGDPPLASSALRRAELAAGTIASELGASGLLEVVRVREGDPVPAGDGGTGAGSVSGEESGAGPDVDFAVSVGGVSEGGTVVMSATITDARRGTVLDRVAETTGSGAPEPELDRFVDRVAGSVAAFADPRMALWIGSSGRPPTLDAYRAFSDGLDLYYRSATSVENFRDLKTAAALRFREADSPEGSFPAAGAWAFWAGRWGEGETSGPRFHRLVKRRQGLAHFDRALVDYIDASTFRGDHEAAYDALRRVVELSGCPEFESGLAEEAVRLNRPRYALCLLEAIDVEGGWCFQEGGRDDPDIPGSNARGYWLLLARHIVGDYEGELRDVRRIRERTADVILPEARALAALGRGGEAVGVLTASVPDPTSRVAAVVAAELARHGDTEAANRILRRYMERFRNLDRTEQIGVVARDAYRAAFAFHLAGAAEELIPLIQEARSTGRVPNPDWERAIVGVLHAAAGNRERALEILRWLDGACVAECPEATPRLIRGAARYMQGAIAAHIGQRTDALLALRDGYPSQVLNIYYDPFLRPLWEDPAFVELLRPQG